MIENRDSLSTARVRATYNHSITIGFSDTTFPNAPFFDNSKFTLLKYSKLPSYSCETGRWSKIGVFVDTTKKDHLLSKTAKWLNKNFGENVSTKTISKYYTLESKSRRIVITDNIQNELIFYLSYINYKWVLTIIDKHPVIAALCIGSNNTAIKTNANNIHIGDSFEIFSKKGCVMFDKAPKISLPFTSK